MTPPNAAPASPIRRYGTAALAEAAALIRGGRPIAVPTETVYGLAADATDGAAVAAIYAAKGRPSFNPLIVHVLDREAADRIAQFDGIADRLAASFWPGPLTLVLPLRPDSGIASLVTAGLATIAIRVPAHRAMRGLLHAAAIPLAAPSANLSGGISPTRAEHVARSLGSRIALILDDGPTAHGLESTIVAPGATGLRLLRPGPITIDMLSAAAGVPVTSGDHAAIEAPGQLASHYAPTKPLRLEATAARGDEWLIGFGEVAGHATLSKTGNLAEAAARLFDMLHAADLARPSAIAVAPIPNQGLGLAINDRLVRAAAPRPS